MIIFLSIVCVILLSIIGLFIYFGYRLVQTTSAKIDLYEEWIVESNKKIDEYEQWIVELNKKIIETYDTMKMLDDKQMFETDDDVGIVYRQISDVVKNLNFFTIDERKGE